MITLVLAIAGAMSAPVVDPGTIQDMSLLEVNTDVDREDPRFCKTVLDPKKPCTTISRTWRLKDEWRTRALALINTSRMTPGAKCAGPRHVLLVETTQGKRAFEWNFDCKLASPAATQEWSEFFYSFGIVQYLPPRRNN